ncbi:transcriptional adapter 1-like [Amphiura filiformis]|uniref:transcriptional adapter 1-like n=1 Tax=Amphiura filiformis TaxID=82378 RepID=UPI003B21AA2C
MGSKIDLKVAKKRLSDVLGEDAPKYWANIKLWYRAKISKEEFDAEARRLLTSENVHYHNEFLVAILTKCQVLAATSTDGSSKPSAPTSHKSSTNSSSSNNNSSKPPTKKAKVAKKKKVIVRATFENRFIPADPMQYLPPVAIRGFNDEHDQVEFCSRTTFLPDISMLHGRVFVTAWEWGLEGVAEKAVPLIMNAVQQLLKNILSGMIARRCGYELRNDGFRHSMGLATETPALRRIKRDASTSTQSSSGSNIDSVLGQGPSVRPTEEESDDSAIMKMVTSAYPPPLPPLSLYDLLDALQVHPSVIPSHEVSCLAMERTLAGLWHPDWDQLMQDDIYRQQLEDKAQKSKEIFFSYM